ncbi:MAG: Radical domain protein [Phycisphaerales bacterium]|nr:Radical domain protein [Phycisphaerales bacterium]
MEFRSDQPQIVLTTLNAKYAHASFGLRYLMANLGPLRERARIVEFDINQRPLDVVEAVLALNPRIVGVGVYIWNAEQSLRLVADLKRIRPETIVVLGGPEVSHETDKQEIIALADYVITGEADIAFAELCEKLLAGARPLMKVIPADLPEFTAKKGEAVAQRVLALPYDFYDDEDVAQRVIYVEASRGCPFRCEFCLSSLDVPVRNVPLETFLPAMDRLLARGVRQFKFVDRTFNLNLNFSRAILEFFWERYQPGLFLHFEMIPDRLPEALREPIRRFPPGALQFEVGVQTFNDEVSERISRRQDNAKLADNVRFLRQETGVHVHADLIVGLPGEDLASFGRGFDRLVELGPQEIQVGILKRLRGTPIVRHDVEWGMAYSPHPPYEVLKTAHMDFATLQRMRRFSRYWDLIANSGNFRNTTPMIWGATEPGGAQRSPFESFMKLSDWLFARIGRNHGIALLSLAELVFKYLTAETGHDFATVAAALWSDYQRGGRSDRPEFLKAYVPEPDRAARRQALSQVAARRQARHLA